MKILLTGVSGFIGRHLMPVLVEDNNDIIAIVRDDNIQETSRVKVVKLPSINKDTNWEPILQCVDAIIHLAARAHVLEEFVADPLEEFRKINTHGTLHLAKCAANSGVKRFIFLSSIGVNGNKSIAPFTEKSVPNPVENYAISKFEAEEGLKKIASETGMEIVIVRPPLVYGPNCPGNFLALLKLISFGLPLPFGAIKNKRSFIDVNNLADFLLRCVERPEAANKTFLIADDEDISTPDLIRHLAKAMNRHSMLLYVPYGLLHIMAKLFGKASVLEKLCGSLQVDSSYARRTLNWVQPTSLFQGLNDVAVWYAASKYEK